MPVRLGGGFWSAFYCSRPVKLNHAYVDDLLRFRWYFWLRCGLEVGDGLGG